MYGAISGASAQQKSTMLQQVENFGIGLATLAAVGIGLRLARNALSPRDDKTDKNIGEKDESNG